MFGWADTAYDTKFDFWHFDRDSFGMSLNFYKGVTQKVKGSKNKILKQWFRITSDDDKIRNPKQKYHVIESFTRLFRIFFWPKSQRH